MGLSKKTAVKTLRQNALTLATLGGVLVGIILGKFVSNISKSSPKVYLRLEVQIS